MPELTQEQRDTPLKNGANPQLKGYVRVCMYIYIYARWWVSKRPPSRGVYESIRGPP